MLLHRENMQKKNYVHYFLNKIKLKKSIKFYRVQKDKVQPLFIKFNFLSLFIHYKSPSSVLVNCIVKKKDQLEQVPKLSLSFLRVLPLRSFRYCHQSETTVHKPFSAESSEKVMTGGSN